MSFLTGKQLSLEETKRGILLIWGEKTLRLIIYFNLLLIFINFLVFGLFWSFLPPEVPLFYSHPWGKEQLAQPAWLIILAAGSFFIFLLNNLAAIYFIRQEKLLSQVLVATSFTAAIIATIALIKIISLIY